MHAITRPVRVAGATVVTVAVLTVVTMTVRGAVVTVAVAVVMATVACSKRTSASPAAQATR